MTSKYTPGPWKFSTDPQPNGCPIVGARGLMVAMLAHSVNHDDQREIAIANARLIAAAPDLLEALRLVTNLYASMRSTLAEKYPQDGWSANTMTLDQAHAAIAKAQGATA